MNERQASAQRNLQEGGSLGQDSLRRPLWRDQNDGGNDGVNDGVDNVANGDGGDVNTEYGTENIPQEKKISKITFGIMIVVAGLLSILAFVLPFIGWLIGTIVMGVTYWALGVKLNKQNILKFGACDVVEIVPLLNIIPAFILSVFLNLGPMVRGVEELMDSVPGGEMAKQVAKITLKGKR